MIFPHSSKNSGDSITCLFSRTTTSREASRTGGFRSALAITASNRLRAASYFFGSSNVPAFNYARKLGREIIVIDPITRQVTC